MGVSSSEDELDVSSELDDVPPPDELELPVTDELDVFEEELDDAATDELDAFEEELDDAATDELDAFEEELTDGIVPFAEGGMYFEAPWLYVSLEVGSFQLGTLPALIFSNILKSPGS